MAETLVESLNRANPDTISDEFRKIRIGQIVRQNVVHTLRKKNPHAAGTAPTDDTTLEVLVLPDDAKASAIIRAYSRAGTGTNGELAVQAAYATPIDGQIAVTPAGNIAVLGVSAYTDVDVSYQPISGDVVEVTGQVVPSTGLMALPSWVIARGIDSLIDANALAGTLTGRMVILAPGASATATGNAKLNVAKSQVKFAIADAVTDATVKLVVGAKVDLDAALESAGLV